MLKKLNRLLLFFSIVFLYYGNAQTNDHLNEVSNFIGQLSSIDVIAQMNALEATPLDNGNDVFISQTGNSNGIEVYSSSLNSEISINQKGYDNDVILNIDSKSMHQNISQNGNGNFYMEYANAPKLNLERTIQQNGTNHSIVIFGSNSITQKLKFNFEGSLKAITIRNFQ